MDKSDLMSSSKHQKGWRKAKILACLFFNHLIGPNKDKKDLTGSELEYGTSFLKNM